MSDNLQKYLEFLNKKKSDDIMRMSSPTIPQNDMVGMSQQVVPDPTDLFTPASSPQAADPTTPIDISEPIVKQKRDPFRPPAEFLAMLNQQKDQTPPTIENPYTQTSEDQSQEALMRQDIPSVPMSEEKSLLEKFQQARQKQQDDYLKLARLEAFKGIAGSIGMGAVDTSPKFGEYMTKFIDSEGETPVKEEEIKEYMSSKAEKDKLRDPNSKISNLYRQYGSRTLGEELTEDLTANEVEKLLKLKGGTTATDPLALMRYQLAVSESQARANRFADSLDERRRKAAESERYRDEQKLDRDTEGLSKRIERSGITSRENAFSNIEAHLRGLGVDLADEKTYDKASIPGIGVAGSLRPDFLTPSDAVAFRQNVKSLANELLHLRSGAAVTPGEYRKFLEESGTGNFSSETNLLSGLAKMKEDLESQKKNIFKGYSPDALAEYKKREGLLNSVPTEEKANITPVMVQMRIPDGRIKLIPEDKVEAAKAAGAEEIN